MVCPGWMVAIDIPMILSGNVGSSGGMVVAVVVVAVVVAVAVYNDCLEIPTCDLDVIWGISRNDHMVPIFE